MNAINIIIKASDMASGVIDGVKKSTDDLRGSFLNSVSASQKAAMGLAAVGVAAGGLIGFGAKISGDLEASRMGFITLLGSAQEADKVLARIKEDAAKTPFELKGLVQANQMLTTVTKDGFKSEKILMDIGKALAAMGRGQPELDRMMINLQQIGSIGHASMIDIKQFGYAGINIMAMLEKHTGKTGEALADMISNGEVTFDMIVELFDKASNGSGEFADAFKNQAGTFNQLVSNMKDTLAITADEIMRSSGLFDMLKNRVAGFISFMEGNKDEIVSAIKAFIDFVKDNAPAIAGMLTGILAPAIIGVALSAGSLILTLTPWAVIFGGISVAINFLVEKMGGWKVVIEKLEDVISSIVGWYKSLSSGQKDILSAVALSIPVIYSAVKAYGAYKLVVQELAPKYQSAKLAIDKFIGALKLSAAWTAKNVPGIRGLNAMIFHTRREYMMATGQLKTYTFFKQQYILKSNLARTATQKLGLAFKFMLGPVGLIIMAVAAVVAILVVLYKKNEDFRNFINSAWASIKDAIVGAWQDYIWPALQAMGDFITGTLWPILQKLGKIVADAWRGFIDFYSWVWPPIREALKGLIGALKDQLWPAIQNLAAVWQDLMVAFIDGGKQIWAALQPAFQALGELWQNVLLPAIRTIWSVLTNQLWPAFKQVGKTLIDTLWPAIKSIASTLWGALKPAFESLWNAIKPVIQAVKDLIKELWPKLWPVLKVIGIIIGAVIVVAFVALIAIIKVAVTTLAVLINIFAFVIKAATPLISFVFKGLALWIGIVIGYLKIMFQVWSFIFSLLWTIAKPIIDLVISYFKMMFQVWSTVLTAIWTVAQSIWNFLWNNIIKPVIDFIVGYFTFMYQTWSNILTTIKDAASTAWNWIYENIIKPVIDFIVAYIQTIVAIAQAVWDAIKNAASSVWNRISSIITGVVNTVKAVWNGIVSWFSGIWDRVKSGVSSVKDGIKNAFTGAMDGAKTAVKTAVNWIIDKINKVIKGVNKVAGKIPGVDLKVPEIPKLAQGSAFARGGMTLVGEHGAEIVNMQRGAKVYSADESKMRGGDGRKVEIHGDVILGDASAVDRFFSYADRLGELASIGVPI